MGIAMEHVMAAVVSAVEVTVLDLVVMHAPAVRQAVIVGVKENVIHLVRDVNIPVLEDVLTAVEVTVQGLVVLAVEIPVQPTVPRTVEQHA